MNTRFLQKIFVVLLVLFLVLLALRYTIEKQTSEFGGFKEITGSMQNFEVSTSSGQNYAPTKTSGRYDGKYLEYLDSKQKSRESTFLR